MPSVSILSTDMSKSTSSVPVHKYMSNCNVVNDINKLTCTIPFLYLQFKDIPKILCFMSGRLNKCTAALIIGGLACCARLLKVRELAEIWSQSNCSLSAGYIAHHAPLPGSLAQLRNSFSSFPTDLLSLAFLFVYRFIETNQFL